MIPQQTWEDNRYYDMAAKASQEISTHPGFRRMREVLSVAPTVLDIGCGEGTKTALIAGDRTGVQGVDVSETALARASQYKHIVTTKVSNEKLPFKDAMFEGIMSCFVMEHIQDADLFMEECARVLKPGGVVALICPNFASPFFTSPPNKKSVLRRHSEAWVKLGKKNDGALLEWERVEPITDREYQTDFDTTLEPSFITMKRWFQTRGWTIQYANTHWGLFRPMNLLGKFFLPAKYLGMLGVYPFREWGPELCIIAEKPTL
jgi:ubiquinone/menaquinone biosynthesis C-methylase UbiE